MTGRAQVIEFADFWTEGSCLLANSILRIPSNRKPTTTTHQSPGRDELAVFEDRRHRVTDGQCGEPLASTDEVRLTKNESGPITTPPLKNRARIFSGLARKDSGMQILKFQVPSSPSRAKEFRACDHILDTYPAKTSAVRDRGFHYPDIKSGFLMR
jgi:hypothetical protein